MPRLFGTNGVRGIANGDLSPELAARLGRAIATWLPEGATVAVARDARTSGPLLEAAACAGLLSAGARVVKLGVCPTPAAQYFVKKREDVKAGLVVTASHNPPQFNGLKLVSGDGTEASRQEEEAVEELFFAQAFRAVPWDHLQPLLEDGRANEEYVRAILSRVDVDAIRARHFRVVLDPGGGPSALTSKPILRELGCEVVGVFDELDGLFRGRESEPTEDHLKVLRETVVKTKADLGVAHDGDADRAIFVDEAGRWVSGDISLTLLGRYALQRRPGIVCTPVATSSLFEEVSSSVGGKVRWTAVGSPIVAREMMRTGAVFGGEENGGVIFPEHQYCRDGAMTLAMMLELLANERQPMSRLVASLPQYHLSKQKFPVPPERKDQLLDRLRDWVSKEFPSARVDRTDGLKVYTEKGWVLIRPSGTEPIFRVFSESRRPQDAQDLAQRFVEAGRRLGAS